MAARKKVASKKKVAAKGESKSRAPRGSKKFPFEATISVLSESNPKRDGTMAYDMFKLYKEGMTVKRFLDLGGRYDPDWWTKQLVQREKLSILPPALEIRKRVAAELARIRKLRREADVRTALASLNEEITRTNRSVTVGPPTSVAAIDIEAFLDSWR